MKRRVCVITGTRADYGLLRWVMQFIEDDNDLELQIIATGMHLSPEYGMTFNEIEKDGFKIDSKVEMLLSSDTGIGIAKSMGLGLIGFADAFAALKPDVLLVLGDRFEVFSAASAATALGIPIAHLHGGETTEGAFDEPFRHSVTKMSHIHMVAAEPYRRRVIQLGERPDSVHTVGGLGIDNINKLDLLEKSDLERALGLKLMKRNLLITFHPVTLESQTATGQMKELLDSLSALEDTLLIFTLPNADTGGRALISLVNEFVFGRPNSKAFTSMGQLLYLSAVAQFDAVVGNSSSGLLEVPSFKKGTINVGDRQLGRIQAKSVITCKPEKNSIAAAIQILYSEGFQSSLSKVENPYGSGGASQKVAHLIKAVNLKSILKKSFFDLKQLNY